MEIRIREATIDDVCSLNELQELYFDEKTRENFEFVLKDQNYLFLVAETVNAIVGYIGVSISFESSDLLTICVHKSYRSRGIAKSLISSIVDVLCKKNVQQILLEVNECNTNAINLYEKMGFKLIHQRKNYYGKDTAFIMKKEL